MGQKAKVVDLTLQAEKFVALDSSSRSATIRRKEAHEAIVVSLDSGESTGDTLKDYVLRWHEGDFDLLQKLRALNRQLRESEGQLVLFVEYGDTHQHSHCVWRIGLLDDRGLVTRSRLDPSVKSSPLEIGVSVMGNEQARVKVETHSFVRIEKHDLLVATIREDGLAA